MTPYDMIKTHLDAAVPFATHVGVKLLEIADGTARAELDQRPETSNHIATQHAGAMFTLGEAASGAAVAGALAPVILQMRPVAATANDNHVITFLRRRRTPGSRPVTIVPEAFAQDIESGVFHCCSSSHKSA